MRISNQHQIVESFHSEHPYRETDIVLTYPANHRNTVREEYIIEHAPYFEGSLEIAQSVNTYSAENGTVSMQKNVVGVLVDVYA